MSGHSRWSNIKRKKAGVDKKKGVLFNRISKELMVAARLGGSEPQGNSRLRIAISRARDANMPLDTIERSIKKGAGELEGVVYEEVVYEAFAQGGVALIIESLTDKKSRTTPEIKNILSKHNANIAEANSVLRLFEKRGIVRIYASKDREVVSILEKKINELNLLEIIVEAGAEDLNFYEEGNYFEVVALEKEFSRVSENLRQKNIPIMESGIEFCLKDKSSLIQIEDEEQFSKITKLIEVLEENEDVQAVTSNLY